MVSGQQGPYTSIRSRVRSRRFTDSAFLNRKLETVASLKNLRRVIMGTGAWLGLTPDGSPLLMRDTGTQEVYALDFEAP